MRPGSDAEQGGFLIAAASTSHGALATGNRDAAHGAIPAQLARAVAIAEEVPPVYAVAMAIVLGDGLGNLHIFAPSWFAIVLAAASAIAFMASRARVGTTLAIVAIVAVSTLPVRDLLAPPVAHDSIRSFPDGAQIAAQGTVVRPSDNFPDRTRIYLQISRAAPNGAQMRAMQGMLRVAVLAPLRFRVGDKIRLSGRIRYPRNNGDPGEFDYEAFMARAGIDATMTIAAHAIGTPMFRVIGYRRRFPASAIESIRDRIGTFLDANLAMPQRAEMRALVIGDRAGIGDDLRNVFARTAMAHLLVISGLHLSFVAAAVFAVARFLMMFAPSMASRGYANKVAAVAAAVSVCIYATISGHHVSTVRALVMVLAYMLAIVIDRAREAVASLALAAIVICIAMPGSTADVGFQLSFASVLAIVLGMRRFAAWYRWRMRRGRLPLEPSAPVLVYAEGPAGYVAVSFWAMLGTTPLTAFHFNQFSIIGLIANAVVVPIMGFGATLAGLLAAAMSFVSTPVARAILHLGAYALEISNRLAGWFAALPMAWSRVFTPTIFELALAYGLLAVWFASPHKPDPRVTVTTDTVEAPTHPSSAIGIRGWTAIAIGVAILLDAGWWMRDRFFFPDLRVTFLSVGEGDSAVVRFPGGRVMLIDGGGAFRGYDYGERVVAPYLWSRKIMHVDYMVMSHPDLDHFGGFAYIADNFSPGSFWSSGATSADHSFEALMTTLEHDGVPQKTIVRSLRPSMIGGVTVSALIPEPASTGTHNNSSIVLRLALGRSSFLFTGDIEAGGEAALIASGENLRAAVLKVPHHGSATSSTQPFIDAVAPTVAVISDGYRNRFHFPAAVVVRRYQSAGATVIRTDRDGAIMTRANSQSIAIRTFRPTHAAPIDAP